MSANWRQNGNWPNRLKDWEQRGSGPEPGKDLWSQIEADLPPPKKRRIFPMWWLMLFGGMLGVTLTFWPWDGHEELTTNEEAPTIPMEAATSRASFHPAVVADQQPELSTTPEKEPGESEAKDNQGEFLGAEKVSSPGELLEVVPATPSHAFAGGGDRLPLEETTTEDEQSTAAITGPAPAPRGPKVASVDQMLPEISGAEAIAGKASAQDNRLDVGGKHQPRIPSPNRPPIGPLPLGAMERLPTSFPELNPHILPTKKFVPVSSTVPLSVHLSAGIIRMRTKVKTPVGVELSPVDRGERFETGNGSFLALGVQKGRFGMSVSYREQPQSNQYFTRRQLNFNRNQEEDSADGLRTSTYEVEAKDGFSESTLEIEIKRSSNSQVNEQDILRVEVRTDQNLDVRSLPLLATYEQPIGRLFALRVGAGFSYNELRLTQSRTLTRVQLGNGLILDQNRLIRGQNSLQKFDYWALHTQAGFFLAPRNFPLTLGVGVDLSRSMGDWWPQRPDGRWLETRGVNVMAGIRF